MRGGLLKKAIGMTGQWCKRRFSVPGHGQTSLTVPPLVVNLDFFNGPMDWFHGLGKGVEFPGER